jgi:hypothetical protein
MAWFSRSKRAGDSDQTPVIGRFSDAYKSEHQYEAWDKAQVHFQNGEVRQGFITLADFLKNKKGTNVDLDVKGERISLAFLQGSVHVHAILDHEGLRAEVDVARAKGADLGLMRSLLEENYKLRYCRYAMTEDEVVQLIFDSNLTDLNAYKIYYALKEVATLADDLDDVAAKKWANVEMISNRHVRALPDRERQIKINFFRSEIDSIVTYMQDAHYDAETYRHALTHMLLSTVYKLDHLLVPHGAMRRALQSIHAIYYHPQEEVKESKNDMAWVILRKLRDMSDDEVAEEIYAADYTFGQTEPVGLDMVRQVFDSESRHFSWYRKKGLDTFAVAINEFIIGYILFNTAPPAPVKDLFRLYYRIGESDLYNALNGSGLVRSNGKLNKRTIIKEVQAIQEAYAPDFPELFLDPDLLDFDDLGKFGYTFLDMIVSTNMKKK